MVDATLKDVLAAVQAETTVEASAVALIQQLVSEIQAANNNNDQATINQILAAAQNNISTLSAAVTVNTPAAPVTMTPDAPVVNPAPEPTA